MATPVKTPLTLLAFPPLLPPPLFPNLWASRGGGVIAAEGKGQAYARCQSEAPPPGAQSGRSFPWEAGIRKSEPNGASAASGPRVSCRCFLLSDPRRKWR